MNITTVSTTVSAVINWILQRGSWSIKQTPTGVELYGETGTARSLSGTVFGAKLPRNLNTIAGGLWYENGPDRDQQHAEKRAQAIARWATRHLHGEHVQVTMAGWEKHPTTSCFGRETLAALGHEAASAHIAHCRALCAEGQWDAADAACVAFGRRFAPIAPWAPEDEWDHVPAQAPAWAA